MRVSIDRPSSCSTRPTATEHRRSPPAIGSIDGARSATPASRFQVAGCAGLQFKPSFKVSTKGKTSRKNGASLDVKLSYPKEAMGRHANIRSVKVNLPKQLPSRLDDIAEGVSGRDVQR